MYERIFNVTVSEDKTYIPKKIEFFLGDVNSSVLKVKILQQGKPFKITDDCRFRVCVEVTPEGNPEEDKIIITQADDSMTTVDPEKQGIVYIKLGDSIMSREGLNMPTHICMYDEDETSEAKFDKFYIDIVKNIHDC